MHSEPAIENPRRRVGLSLPSPVPALSLLPILALNFARAGPDSRLGAALWTMPLIDQFWKAPAFETGGRTATMAS
ncbi:hypothetical protein ABT063_18200 [Streptomyces sp. NPDC002838]|uniref:hypothetical protein n=1 Tax=Streptomyces sp. NPDC002838 TaxID=3154436 RepID=UPI00332389DB